MPTAISYLLQLPTFLQNVLDKEVVDTTSSSCRAKLMCAVLHTRSVDKTGSSIYRATSKVWVLASASLIQMINSYRDCSHTVLLTIAGDIRKARRHRRVEREEATTKLKFLFHGLNEWKNIYEHRWSYTVFRTFTNATRLDIFLHRTTGNRCINSVLKATMHEPPVAQITNVTTSISLRWLRGDTMFLDTF